MANKIAKRYQVKLNSPQKIEELLQQLYDESDRIIVEIQTEMNKLANSIDLSQEIVDGKAKYAKAMNDYLSNKDKAIGRKLDIAKLMSEILKYNGNVKLALNEGEVPDWDEFTNALVEDGTAVKTDNVDDVEKYSLR